MSVGLVYPRQLRPSIPPQALQSQPTALCDLDTAAFILVLHPTKFGLRAHAKLSRGFGMASIGLICVGKSWDDRTDRTTQRVGGDGRLTGRTYAGGFAWRFDVDASVPALQGAHVSPVLTCQIIWERKAGGDE